MRIIFDLDGTLADISHRLHFIKGEEKDWEGFFAACFGDRPILPACNLFMILSHHPKVNVEIWTGRSSGVRVQTRNWLGVHVPEAQPLKLLMRAHGDHQPDVELKRAWLHNLRENDEDVDLVFEDRDAVVKMWREEGVSCYQVAAGDF